MKKIIGCLALVGCLGLTLTGCKGSTNDVEKQIEKMEETVKEGKIFEDDRVVIITRKYTNDKTENSKIKYIKDENKSYFEVEENGKTSKIWIEEGEKESTLYINVGAQKYLYTVSQDEYGEGNVILELLQMASAGKAFYNMIIEEMEKNLKTCKDKGVSCEVEKTLGGKVTYTHKQDKESTTYIVKGGKVVSVKEVKVEGNDTEETTAEIEYENQKVELPNKASYTKK